MDRDIVARKIFEGKPRGKKIIGGPRLRWLEAVEKGLLEKIW